jgi:hypothetical protein
MFINPNLATRLAREHQRELLAEASQRQQLRHRPGLPAPDAPGPDARITRRLAAAIARARWVAAQAQGAILPTGPSTPPTGGQPTRAPG